MTARSERDAIESSIGGSVDTITLSEWRDGATSVYGGQNVTLTWPGFAQRVLTEATRVVPKAQSVYFNVGKNSNGYRCTESTINATMLAFDADDVGRWDRIVGFARVNRLASCAYESSGHCADGPFKWRFCFPLTRPVTLDSDAARNRFRAGYRKLAALLKEIALLKGNFDLSLASISQAVYYGHRREEAAPARRVIWRDGQAFDFDRFCDLAVTPPPSAVTDFDVEPMTAENVTAAERVSRIHYWRKTWRRTLDELKLAVSGGRTSAMCAAARFHGKTAHWGLLSDEQAKDEILETARCCKLTRDYDEDDLVRQIGNNFTIGKAKKVPDLTTRPSRLPVLIVMK